MERLSFQQKGEEKMIDSCRKENCEPDNLCENCMVKYNARLDRKLRDILDSMDEINLLIKVTGRKIKCRFTAEVA
jgi:hypothetical protein